MFSVNLAQAKARLSEIMDKVEAGQEVVITRRGKAVAQISATSSPKKSVPLEKLAIFRDGISLQDSPSGETLRELRDES
ncbi:MAG: type II toxin-antitoxin system prevent-host-death family antitoxin [Gammaproteobacteria bacterium]|nr:type II toxin-antitoxin system prevent-host-death family antitoxin [Gammaproteobacteria bacterium]MCY4273917.1 type II toxin-antitoxin system prevent-host-death family antitoxin [Gammaproteobacteria bacterium]